MNALQTLRKELHQLVKQADEIQRQIARRTNAIAALSATEGDVQKPKKRKLSPATVRKIKAGMKKKWKERKQAAKK